MKIIITEEQKKKLFIPRKLSSDDSRYSDWNNSQPIKDGVRINQYDPEGRKTGYWEEYWDGSTKLYSKGKYKKGNQEGMWEYYENNGDLWIKGNFKNNKEDGVWEDYVNNKLKAKFLYDKGRLIQKIPITESEQPKKKLFIPRKLSGEDSRYSEWNKQQPSIVINNQTVDLNQYSLDGKKIGIWVENPTLIKKNYDKTKLDMETIFNNLKLVKPNNILTNYYYQNKLIFQINRYKIITFFDLYFWREFKNKHSLKYKNYSDIRDLIRLWIEIKNQPITESKKLFIPRKLSQDDSRYSEWNNNQPVIDGIKINQYDPEGRKQGMWMTYFRDGRLNSKGTYKDNEKDGLWEEYWGSSGKLMVKGYYINGKEDGLWEDYWTNGNLENKGQYINGKMEGMWESYWSNGNPHSKGKYINDNKHGIWEFYFDDGSLEKKILYNNDRIKNLSINESKKLFIPRKLSGEGSRWEQWNKEQPIKDGVQINQYDSEGNKQGYWEFYNDNDGSVRSKGLYKNGLRYGEWEEYWTNGNLRLKCNMVNNKREGVWEWYDYKGNLESKILYDDNILVKDLPLTESEDKKNKLFIPRKLSNEDSRYSEWNNKQPIKDGKRINQYDSEGNKQGMWYDYYDGKLYSKGNYINNKKEGYWETYHSNGQLEGKVSYVNGKRNGICEYYWANGNLWIKDNYVNGKRNGACEYYNKDGSLNRRELFKNGKYNGELPLTESEDKKKLFIPRKIEDRYSNWNEQQPTITLDNHTLKLNQYDSDGKKIGLWLNKPEIINQNYIETKPFMENLFNNLNVVKTDRFTNYKLNDKIIFQNRNDDTLTYFNNDFWTSFETKYQVFHFETKDLIRVWMEIKYGLGHLYPHQVV